MSDEIQQKYCFEYKIPLTFSLNMKIPLKKSPRRSLVVNIKLCRSTRSIFSNVTPGALRQFSESHNEPQIGNCSLNRRLPKMWTYITTLFSYNIVVSCACAATTKNENILKKYFQLVKIFKTFPKYTVFHELQRCSRSMTNSQFCSCNLGL